MNAEQVQEVLRLRKLLARRLRAMHLIFAVAPANADLLAEHLLAAGLIDLARLEADAAVEDEQAAS